MLLSLLLLSTALALPRPEVIDVHETQIQVDSIPTRVSESSDEVLIGVARLDNLIDDQTGALLATRSQLLKFTFEINGGFLICNNHVVPLGISNMQLETTLVQETSYLASDEVVQQFEVGIVSVNLGLTWEPITSYGLSGRKLTLYQQINEVNSKTTEVIQVVENIIYVWPNGHMELRQSAIVPESFETIVQNIEAVPKQYIEEEDDLEHMPLIVSDEEPDKVDPGSVPRAVKPYIPVTDPNNVDLMTKTAYSIREAFDKNPLSSITIAGMILFLCFSLGFMIYTLVTFPQLKQSGSGYKIVQANPI